MFSQIHLKCLDYSSTYLGNVLYCEQRRHVSSKHRPIWLTAFACKGNFRWDLSRYTSFIRVLCRNTGRIQWYMHGLNVGRVGLLHDPLISREYRKALDWFSYPSIALQSQPRSGLSRPFSTAASSLMVLWTGIINFWTLLLDRRGALEFGQR